MSDVKLKTCPFCGGEAKFCYEDGISVSCTVFECIIGGLFTLGFDSKEEAVERWNIRHCGSCKYVEGYKSRNAELEDENQKLKKQIAEYNKEYHDDHATVPYLNAEIAALREKNEQLKTEIHHLEDNYDAVKGLLQFSEERIGRFEKLLGRYVEFEERHREKLAPSAAGI